MVSVSLSSPGALDIWEPEQGLVACKPYPMQFDSAHEDDLIGESASARTHS